MAQLNAAASMPRPLHPLLQDFQNAIVDDPALFALANQLFEQLPRTPAFEHDPTGQPQLRNMGHALQMIDRVLRTPPTFNQTGITGLPINAIFDWSMATPGGHAFFLHLTVNVHLKRILNAWGDFLKSPASLPALSNDPHLGWFGTDALAHMPDFDEEFECEPGQPYRGFRSWDDFFTRRFRSGRRPVSAPGDDTVIVNACEAAPFRLARDVRLHDRFWIKAQPYSLHHMLAGDDLAQRFDGGTVYQAFLSSFSYHRWHSPVTGRVVRTRVIDGSYYAQCQEEGFDPCSPRQSQAYITQVATRALIFIQADHPGIGLMCFVAVGMAEVSTCDVTVVEGQHLQKGEQLGMFHFGGSTHCLVFGPDAMLEFDLRGQTPGLEATNIPINERIATVRPSGNIQASSSRE
ncbi:phosphatidylserine decarboxylase family protein [Massilia sp. CF038]|uniref:phosphatidylserine decarboxylase family protein n=1 Tax=Massilia sp. CF038 TaxID=1881045 RepID=UPI001161220A|nr:phosphatidylserine decarboxylase family protein [Massilia sp. CF038]